MSVLHQPLAWDNALIQRYNLNGPRYTSYPTAPQFQTDFNLGHWQQAMETGNCERRPLSLYLHIPFCNTVCFYCGCNKVITGNRQRTRPYLAAIKQEISFQASCVDRTRPVNQLHWGGGTPTYLDDQQITELMDHIRAEFPLRAGDEGEYSLEIHPQSVTPERLDHLRALGFNRLSFGVQDFNPEVQKAVNRFNSREEVATLINASRHLGFRSLNLDLIYGLPKQSVGSFADTLNTIIELRPDRISLFNYAHMPHLFKTQKQINERDLPEPLEKLRILQNSVEQLQDAGYIYIGMDHFALPDDELAIAQRNGTLHRNFQGYSTHDDCDLLAFGVSSIGAVNDVFVQNYKEIDAYQRALENRTLAIQKGFRLSFDDCLRRQVINKLMCQFHLKFGDVENEFKIVFTDYFAAELKSLEPMEDDGLLKICKDDISISNIGRLLIRHVCMVFDVYLKNQKPDTGRIHSKII